jgi:isoleucyl-tRNA synthetase
MDAYDNFNACAAINDFVDGLSNWYVRRSRDRFWSSDKESADKRDAYWTLYECLLMTSKLIAPFVPFIAEVMWRNLTGGFDKAIDSVHLCDYPLADDAMIDNELSERMRLVRVISSLGRAARMKAKLKVRQPLSKVEVILADDTHLAWLQAHAALICDELNVKEVGFPRNPDQYITYRIQPNFKRLGPRVGKQLPRIKKALASVDARKLLADIAASGRAVLELGESRVELERDDVEKQLQAREGYVAEDQDNVVVVLSTELTDELVREGLVKDLVRLIQDQRKQIDCNYTDRIYVGVVNDSTELKLAIRENRDYILRETLALDLVGEPLSGVTPTQHEIGGETVELYVQVSRDQAK